jgi:hypothetical protein
LSRDNNVWVDVRKYVKWRASSKRNIAIGTAKSSILWFYVTYNWERYQAGRGELEVASCMRTVLKWSV